MALNMLHLVAGDLDFNILIVSKSRTSVNLSFAPVNPLTVALRGRRLHRADETLFTPRI